MQLNEFGINQTREARKKQLDLGFDIQNDLSYQLGELNQAAIAYLLPQTTLKIDVSEVYPWEMSSYKGVIFYNNNYDVYQQQIENLSKAAALIVAQMNMLTYISNTEDTLQQHDFVTDTVYWKEKRDDKVLLFSGICIEQSQIANELKITNVYCITTKQIIYSLYTKNINDIITWYNHKNDESIEIQSTIEMNNYHKAIVDIDSNFNSVINKPEHHDLKDALDSKYPDTPSAEIFNKI